MYNFKNWVDRVTQFVNRFKETNNSDGSITHERVDGEVLKTGTSQSAANFNNMEGGILENSLLLAEATRVLKEHGRDIEAMTGEMHAIYLYNTAKYPANNSKKTIALKQPRNNTDYIIAARVVSAVMPNGVAIDGDPAGTAGNIKLDWRSNKWTFITDALTGQSESGHGTGFNALATTLSAVPQILYGIGVYPQEPNGDYGSDDLYAINQGERIPIRGGGWLNTSGAGVFKLDLDRVRSDAYGGVGRRSAFVGSL